ncbi:hypothetical protein FA13DRAFT_1719411 [Coprinellus micaceus]|uniref:Uncharacterized protein n=1 Tax=Coprinellus micaceus TaxID=71717 RepID=A0A4Y7SBT3_COPMI|nr:hypothetical protein FA13DRAFT_1719411 [Coprinellus micaceus]
MSSMFASLPFHASLSPQSLQGRPIECNPEGLNLHAKCGNPDPLPLVPALRLPVALPSVQHGPPGIRCSVDRQSDSNAHSSQPSSGRNLLPMTSYTPPAVVCSYRLRNMTDLIIEAQFLHNLAGDKDEGGPCIYHFDSQCQGLKKWAWPCYLGRDGLSTPVSPDELEEHSREYAFRTPCCPCAYLRGVSYTPTKISLLESVNGIKNDPLKRPFIAKRFEPDLLAFMKARDQDVGSITEASGFRRILISPQTEGFGRGANNLKRESGALKIALLLPTDVPKGSQEDDSAPSFLDGVDNGKIDRLMTAGLAEDEFWELFVQCATCGHVSPRTAYPYAHRCAKKVKLTDENLCLRDTDFLEVMAAEAEEEDRLEDEEIEALDRQIDVLRAAMHPRSLPRRGQPSSSQ